MSKAADYFWVTVLAVISVGILVLIGLIVVPKIVELLPDPRPAASPVPGIDSVGEVALPNRPAEQPFIAEEIERISEGNMDVVQVTEHGDFAVTVVIWVKEPLTEAQGVKLDELLASEYPIIRLVNVASITQLGNEVLVLTAAYDCVSTGIETSPLRCVRDEAVAGGYVIPDEALVLLND